MSTPYTHTPDSGSFTSQMMLALILTGSIFAFLPILQILPDFLRPNPNPTPIIIAREKPPIVIEPKPDQIDEKIKPEKPELKKPLDKIDLHQMELLLIAGPGDSFNHINIGNPEALFTQEGFEDLYEIDELHRIPRALFQIEPIFPYALKQLKREGWVILEWIITDQGRVHSIKVIQSSHREFQQPAIDSIMKSKWKPGEVSNKPVNTRVRQKIAFNL